MKDYNTNKESSYLQYMAVTSQNLPVNNFVWIEDTSRFNEDLLNNHNEENDNGYFIGIHVQHTGKLHQLHVDLLFSLERMKIEKVERLKANLHDKTEFVVNIFY